MLSQIESDEALTITDQLTYEQLNDSIGLSEAYKPQLLHDKVVQPMYIKKRSGDLLTLPKFLSSESAITPENPVFGLGLVKHNETKSLELNKRILIQDFSNIEQEFWLSEKSLFQDILIQIQSSVESVAPGGIAGGVPRLDSTQDIPPKIADLFPAELHDDIVEWSNDKCNDSRDQFSSSIESSMYDMFDQLIAGYSSDNTLSLEKRNELSSIAKNFDHDCLKTYQSAVDNGEIGEAIQSRLVVFTLGSVPFCSGIRVSSHKVLTARHCFYDIKKGGSSKYYAKKPLRGLRSQEVTAYVLDDIYSEIGVVGFDFNVSSIDIGKQSKKFGVKNDFIFVQLDKDEVLSDPDEFAELDISGAAKLYEPIILVGYYAFHNADQFYGIDRLGVSDWRDGLRLTKGSYCRVFDVSSGGQCIVHACQSLSLFSGGGILSMSHFEQDGKIRLLGINTLGGEGAANDCTPYKLTGSSESLVGNQGGLALASDWIFD